MAGSRGAGPTMVSHKNCPERPEDKSGEESSDSVTHMQTDKDKLPADMVILAIGVRVNAVLAQRAGLAISKKTRAIRVDDHMRASDPDIYTAGDCIECTDCLTCLPCFVPLGSSANKQGRVPAVNIADEPLRNVPDPGRQSLAWTRLRPAAHGRHMQTRK